MTKGHLIDTSVLIDMLNEIEPAKRFMDDVAMPAISVVTWIEVMVGAQNTDEEFAFRNNVLAYPVLGVTSQVVEETVRIRRATRLKLPDAIIWATARCHDLVLVTRNWRDFPATDAAVHVP